MALHTMALHTMALQCMLHTRRHMHHQLHTQLHTNTHRLRVVVALGIVVNALHIPPKGSHTVVASAPQLLTNLVQVHGVRRTHKAVVVGRMFQVDVVLCVRGVSLYMF